jgi:thiol-disulfide isomerase/thioredoxin
MDLLEGTKRGSIISYIAIITMALLFIFETAAFMSTSVLQSDISLDRNQDPKLRVNINITMMDLSCDYATVDIVSPLGTSLNVTSHLSKYSLDAGGVRDRYKGRNQQQNDIILSDSLVVNTLEELHENGEDAVSLDAESLKEARKTATYLFVDFYASWCSHCKDLAPTWEVLAETMTEAAMELVDEEYQHLDGEYDYSKEEYEDALKVKLPVMVAKVDCVEHKQLCFEQQIWAYPTLRLFVNGNPAADYRGDRTVLEMVHWLAHVEEVHKTQIGEENFNVLLADEIAREHLEIEETREEMIKGPDHASRNHPDWAEKMRKHRVRQSAMDWKDDEHPGCQISGFLWVDRVPGNFHIQARSPHHDIDAKLTNTSHEVHHLSFGDPNVEDIIYRNKLVTPEGFTTTLSPLDGNVYINYNQHEAFHHYLKVVTTDFDDPYLQSSRSRYYKKSGIRAYQILSSSQLSFYRSDIVPEAKFSYDPSPIAVFHRRAYNKRWYDYITSLMAIIGGSFTVLGMIENTLHAVNKKKK